MRVICGVDGRKGGWIAIYNDIDSGNIFWRTYDKASDLIFGVPTPEIIAIDIPIGLPDQGSRDCGIAVRECLKARRSSVFSAPILPVLSAKDYKDACRIRSEIEAKKLSLQTWAIVCKIREVDDLLCQNPTLQLRVRE